MTHADKRSILIGVTLGMLIAGLGAVMLIGCATLRTNYVSKAEEAKVKMLEQCLLDGGVFCEGAKLKFKNGRIVRLSYCLYCASDELEMRYFKLAMLSDRDFFINQIEWILPGNQWKQT